ncbi:peptide-methionine (S)-S-oxide reductase MsrA [Uliginosibacterium gangwonense]|uniref:peptide-methionine (S)-S-oxide reductase MsrA n=1 Tax=Uliginosibacterium gangwonense TaxID=392736 RepID=UPI00036F8BF3|nr:peptide-methionine (S)-S-oxide reductase MsrA [Uliginosibacterium gangwonense]
MTEVHSDNVPAQETAIFAGGCFWCTEAVFQAVRGVISVEPGYTGGTVPNPTYNQVCTGETGHVEAVRIVFDPAQVKYRQLLEVFFVIHDPTQRNRQGNDIGPQYRSAIFWFDERQEFHCSRIIEELRRIQAFLAPIVTEVKPAQVFYPAENYHRNYFLRNPAMSYCQRIVAPKLVKLRQTFAALCAPPA